jgi:hypothetical protein
VEIRLLYSEATEYSSSLSIIQNLTVKAAEKWNVKTTFLDVTREKNENLEKLKADIRSVPPQVRGRIVTSRNYLLPLSSGKNLNVTNTPIAIVYEDNGIPSDVYPHLIGTFYMTIEEFLERMIKMGPSNYFSMRGLLEDPIMKILSDSPSTLEKGMHYIDCEVKTSVGDIDILLRDKRGKHVVVEIETNASENAVSQVCRLASGYASYAHHNLNKIRKIIVCLNYDKSILESSKGANVEVYQLCCRNIT